jgi:hypothetical protein
VDKAAYPPLVEVVDAVAVQYLSYTSHATQCSADVFKHHQKICELECMFFLWI